MGDDILSHMGCRVTDMKVVPCLDLYACSSASSLVLHYYLCPIYRKDNSKDILSFGLNHTVYFVNWTIWLIFHDF